MTPMPTHSHTGYALSLQQLMQALASLPGVGSRSAERIAFALLKDSVKAQALADALIRVRESVRYCSSCYNLTESDPCPICADAARDRSLICVVEQPKDLIQLESTGAFRGTYHVLLGHLAPLENIGPGQLSIAHLLERISAAHATATPVREVILALNPTTDGDATALYLQQELSALGLSVTRLARGLPLGAQIEYSNKAILADALTGRTKV
jgi:recombination protein RecR